MPDEVWTVILLGASGGFGLGLGVVLAAAIARAVRRYIDPGDDGPDERRRHDG